MKTENVPGNRSVPYQSRGDTQKPEKGKESKPAAESNSERLVKNEKPYGEFKKTDSLVRGWRSIHVTDGDMPYMDKWWVPGLQIGYEHSFVHQVADFIEGLQKGEPVAPTFRDALETQRVCDAILKSADSHQWVDV